VLGAAGVGAAFAVRAFADTRHLDLLEWASPLALRATVRPFLDERWWVLVVYLAVAAALAGLATVLSDRREFGAGLVRRRDRHDARLEITSDLGLTRRLARRSVLTWTVAVAGTGTLFAAMGADTVEQGRRGNLDGFLGSQLGTVTRSRGTSAMPGRSSACWSPPSPCWASWPRPRTSSVD